jgi:hypothetical protein
MKNIKDGKKVLHLTLKKKWFDMIASGEKTEEYREIKPYWSTRLMNLPADWCKSNEAVMRESEWTRMDFTHVSFRNGYRKNAPSLTFKMNEIRITTGFQEWGAEPGKKYFVIKLGEKIESGLAIEKKEGE